MHGTSYNLDAKIEIYEDRFKWIFARLGELLHQDGLTPDYLDPFKIELKQLRKDLQDNSSTVNKLIEDVDLEHKKYIEQLSQKLDDSVKKLENDILSAQIGGNTGLVSSLQILYDELKKYHDQDKGELEIRLINIEADVVTSRNDLLNFETETKARFDSMKNIMDVHEKFIGTEIGKINAIMDDNKEELISQVDDLDKKVDQKIKDSKNLLTSSIEATKNELTTQVASLDNKLTSSIEATKNEVTSEISSINQKMDQEIEKTITAVNSVQDNLDKEIVSRTSELDQKITTQISTLDNKINSKIEDSKNEVTTQLDSTKQDILNEINTTQTELQGNINQIDTKVDNLRPLIITESQIQSMLTNFQSQLMEKLYPIGHLYITADRNILNPNSALGTNFTWEEVPTGYKLRTHPNAGDYGGTDWIDIDHTHGIDFRWGNYYGYVAFDQCPNVGLPSYYDKSSNQPAGWSSFGGFVGKSRFIANACAQRANQWLEDTTHIYQCTGRTSYAFHDKQVEVTGKVYNIRAWKRTA